VPRPPLCSENLRDNGLIAGSLQALSVCGVLSKIGGRDFLHCTNLVELTAQAFTRTVSITLATKMQSTIAENITDQEIEKRVLRESIRNRNHELAIEEFKIRHQKFLTLPS
jgi:hypothetical protein